MTKQRPKKTPLPLPPTLHLDKEQAWRQGEDAVFLPIAYNPPPIKPANPDAIIIQIAAPLSCAAPAEVLSVEEKKQHLVSLRKKAETGDFSAPKKDRKKDDEIDPSFADFIPTPDGKPKYLSRSVPLLLLGVVALVFFAWMAFR